MIAHIKKYEQTRVCKKISRIFLLVCRTAVDYAGETARVTACRQREKKREKPLETRAPTLSVIRVRNATSSPRFARLTLAIRASCPKKELNRERQRAAGLACPSNRSTFATCWAICFHATCTRFSLRSRLCVRARDFVGHF